MTSKSKAFVVVNVRLRCDRAAQLAWKLKLVRRTLNDGLRGFAKSIAGNEMQNSTRLFLV